MINRGIKAVIRNWQLSSLVLLIITLVTTVLLWNKPDVLQFVSFILIGAGTIVACIATVYTNNHWTIIGTILLAAAGVGAGYFGNVASAHEMDEVKRELSKAHTEVQGLRRQLSEAQGDMKVLIAVTELKDRSQEMSLSETQKRLSIVYQKLFSSQSQEADEWAKRFTELQSVREKGYKEREQELRDKFEKEASFIPILFRLVLQMFDERLLALSKIIDGISISKLEEVPNELIFEAGQKPGIGEIRIVKLPNSRSIKVEISFGEKHEGLIRRYPGMQIQESPSPPRPKRDWNISLGHNTGCFMGGCPMNYPSMNDKNEVNRFMNNIGERLDKMLSEVLAR